MFNVAVVVRALADFEESPQRARLKPSTETFKAFSITEQSNEKGCLWSYELIGIEKKIKNGSYVNNCDFVVKFMTRVVN